MNRLTRQTFDDFIVGDGNRAAYMAAREVARNPGGRYNPLFIYGGTGTGKSHLLAAIEREVALNDPSISIHYMSYPTLALQVREVLDTGSRDRIQQTLSKVDLFLLDDVRDDEMWLPIQQELTDWIDRYIREERQIVFTSDRSPLSLDPYEEKFLSRIQLGLVVSIGRADRVVKRELISRVLDEENVESADDALDCLADLPVGDIRELAGIVNRLLVSLKAEKTALTRVWLTAALQQLIKTGEIRKFRIASAVRPGTETIRREWFETTEIEEPELDENEVISIDEMDVRSREESPGGGEQGVGGEKEDVSVRTLGGEDDEPASGVSKGRGPLEVDESEGFFMEWDREIDRLLDEL